MVLDLKTVIQNRDYCAVSADSLPPRLEEKTVNHVRLEVIAGCLRAGGSDVPLMVYQRIIAVAHGEHPGDCSGCGCGLVRHFLRCENEIRIGEPL